MKTLLATISVAVAVVVAVLWQSGSLDRIAHAAPHTANKAATEDADATAPPDRSTHYSASGSINYGSAPRFDSSAAMTIEAWIYRADDSGCEAILDHNLSNSYYFGTCPAPRFYRSGPDEPATGTVSVPARHWTHVAVSYDGAIASFFVNGEAAGSKATAFLGLTSTALRVGGGPAGNYWNGYLDEVRLWSVARTQEQIRDHMYAEITDRSGHTGLQAIWADGGRHEILEIITGAADSGISGSAFGVLPRDLVVPRSAVAPTLDGSVNVNFEYAGAEKLTIRYSRPGDSDAPADKIAHLIYTEDDLYIGLPSASLFAPDWDEEDSWIGLWLDPTFGREATVQTTQTRLRILLDSTDASTSVWQVGNGSGGWTKCTDPDCPQRGVEWDVRKKLHFDDVGPSSLAVEIRIAKSILGEWTEVDGLMMGQFSAGDPPANYTAPSDARGNSPATWAVVSYGEGSAALPQVSVSGRVLSGKTTGAPPVAGHKVTFGVLGTVTYEQTTNVDGEFSFDVPMPANQSLTLQVQQCSFCRFGEPTSAITGTKPAVVYDSSVVFPVCDQDECALAATDFYVMHPVGATVLENPPQVPVAVIELNSATNARTPPQTVILEGENLHDALQFYLSPDTGQFDQSAWQLYEATIQSVSADLKTVTLNVPVLPRTTRSHLPDGPEGLTLNGKWRWVVKDNWPRPDWSDAFRSDPFWLISPPYPEIYGFGFNNEDDDATLNEFLGVYGNSAYVCVGGFGVCATRVIDPLYKEVYFQAYKQIINDSGGSCVGMSATSLLMRAGDITPAQFSDEALFAAGFGSRDNPAKWKYDGILGKVTGPPKPDNLWAHIRRNHGTQVSTAVWRRAIDQFADHSTDGHIGRRLDVLRANPDGYVISMKNPDKTFGGHAVTPYSVVGNRVFVYDNNAQRVTGRYIDFNTNSFTFPAKSWTGGTLFTFSIDIWRGERHFPIDFGIDNLLPIFVVGEGDGGTDPLISTPAGSWGTAADGTFMETLPGVVPIPIPGQTQEGPVSGPLLVPSTGPSPTVTVNSHDEEYLFMTGYGDSVLQLQVSNSTPGDRDIIALSLGESIPASMTVTPARDGTVYVPKVGMNLSEQERLLFRFWQLQLPGGKPAEFQSLPEERGVLYTNGGDGPSTYQLIVDSVDGAVEEYGTYRFGPLQAPAGAAQRISVAEWPLGDRLRVETDTDGDGVFEDERFVSGLACASDDDDLDGIPDQCAAGPDSSTFFLPLLAR